MQNPRPHGPANYRIENTGTATVVQVFNEIDIANVNVLGDALFGAIESGRPVVIDLTHLEYIDSVGLHILLRTFQRAARARIEAVLVANGLIRQLVDQVGLDRVVHVVPDVPSAVQALKTKSGCLPRQP